MIAVNQGAYISDVFLPMERIFSTTVGIILRFPFHLRKTHLERNFGVKITPSRPSLNARTFPCLHYVIVLYTNIEFNFSLPHSCGAHLKLATCSMVESQLPAAHEKKSHNAKTTQNVFVWQKSKEHRENLAPSWFSQTYKYIICRPSSNWECSLEINHVSNELEKH